ncbi:helix-turn-helix domain-containing protein [Pedobacter sp. MC2016-24]|uniref:helix-turn-helix domain-containing protein n=1 Tax=Pedobacter sp. MC2016-24 TaxID=2780090 RepID=UPI001882E869|nr:helix-turn-helix transcriptional regulator [Pedobacter sp. MC2016-24]MBE9600129.1 helix-turn-helix transcriptional regulator [Pedobacter sp. MC2016-24]
MQEILSKKDIGERIKDLRVKNGLSQATVATVLGLSRSNYSQIELGNQFPTFNTLHVVARYYSKSYDWLLHGAELRQTLQSPVNLSEMIDDLECSLKKFSTSLQAMEHELKAIKQKHARFK